MKPAADRLPARAWLVVILLWFVACFDSVNRIMLATMHGSILASIPMTEAQFGLLLSVYLWVCGLVSPFGGFLSDVFSRSRVIVLTLVFWSAITLLTVFATTFGELLIARGLLAVGEAVYIPAALALICDYHRGRTRSLAVGVHMTGLVSGAALGGLGGWFADLGGWHYAFIAVGTMGVVICLAVACWLRDAPREKAEEPREDKVGPKMNFGEALASLFGHGSYCVILAYCALSGALSWIILGWMATYLKEHFHLGQGVAGFSAIGYLSIASVFGMLVGGAWADRWRRVDIRGYIYVTVIGLCSAVPGVLVAVRTDALTFAILGLILYGFTYEFSSVTLMPILCQIVKPRYLATGCGVAILVMGIAGGLAVYAAGILRDLHFDTGKILTFSAAGLLLCAVLLLLVRPSPSSEYRPEDIRES